MASKRFAHLLIALWITQMGLSIQIDSYSLGVSLGPSQITAARFNSIGQPDKVTRIAGSPAYQSYMADVLEHEGERKQWLGEWYIQDGDSRVPAPPDTHDEEHAQMIFTEALVSLNKAAARALGDQKVSIGAVTAPQYLNDSSRGAIMHALQDVEPNLRQFYQVIVGSHATRQAYGLNSCASFGLGDQKCDIDDGTHYVLVVEFERRYLQLSLLDVGADTVGNVNRARFSELGEEGGVNQGSSEDGAHYRHIQEEIRAFMVNNNVGPKQVKEDFLQAVIISGEASDASFGHLRSLIKELLHEQGKDDILRDTVQPVFVLAFGAAYQAMLFEKSPELLDDNLCLTRLDVPEQFHDEL